MYIKPTKVKSLLLKQSVEIAKLTTPSKLFNKQFTLSNLEH